MADQILSGLLGRIGNFLATRYEADRAVRKLGIGRLKNELDLLNRSIKQANEEEYSVMVYAEQMREAAMLIEDVLDVYDLLAVNASDYLRQTGDLIATLISHRNLGGNIENINTLLVNLRDKGERYGISNCFLDTDIDHPVLVNEPGEHLLSYGIEAYDLTDALLEGRESRRSVFAVWGGGRTGKTALAARTYNSKVAMERFEIRVWFAVPESHDELGGVLMRQILRRHWPEHQGSMVNAVRKFLRKKRFLIVLDDVWSDELWSFMRDVLPDDCVGSKVLITTRSEAVADSFVETTSDRVYQMVLGKLTSMPTSRQFTESVQGESSLGGANMTIFRRLDLAIRGLLSTKPKLERVASTSFSFASDGLSFFSDDIED